MIIDDKDFELVLKNKWHFSGLYASANIDGKTTYMHRLITKAKKGQECDHINHDKLDNRRKNLRVCTSAQNKMNRPPLSTNKSGYKGVSFENFTKSWKAQISLGNKSRHIGRYPTSREAAKAYNEMALQLHDKEFVWLNPV